MPDVVLVEVTDGVADVRLNRPRAMNVFNDDMFEALIDLGQSLCAETGLRAVVLSGKGRGFCAGSGCGVALCHANHEVRSGRD
jgi:enoyl-CoA hydratase/carnithine racemase